MPNTYTQIHIHFVFAIKHRQSLINESIRERVEKYITGIVQNHQHKLLAIYCMPDHTHLFIGFRTTQTISDLMREVKSRSSEFINEQKLTKEKFNWQQGYGAFSYSHSHVTNVIEYILHQPDIIKIKLSGKNMWNCLPNLKFHTKKNIYLTVTG